MPRIAIIGLGPWGLCALERIVTSMRECRSRCGQTEVHVIEPSVPGIGIYDTAQPDFLEMNTSCFDISLFPAERAKQQASYGLGLYEWAVSSGYRWVGDRCRVDRQGRHVEPEHFLPRRVMGEYLSWFYRSLVSAAPARVTITHHPTLAVDVVQRRDGCEEVFLAKGGSLTVEHVILTFGHAANSPHDCRSSDLPLIAPYPISRCLAPIKPDAQVGILGMGLVGADVLAALTLGRGGSFVTQRGRLIYRPSGHEPAITLMSPSGIPYRAKTVGKSELPERHRPIVFDPEIVDKLQDRGPASTDFRTEILPLIQAEMRARYYLQCVFNAGGAKQCLENRAQLQAAWVEGRFTQAIERLAVRFGAFDPDTLLFPAGRQYSSSNEYQDFVYSSVCENVHEQEGLGNASPTTAAVDVLRIFRDVIRSAVEYRRLTLASHRDFHRSIRKSISRLVSGPPTHRLQQMIALMDAGVVRLPYGPAPTLLTQGDQGTVAVSSTALRTPYADRANVLVRGYLETPSIEATASPLLHALCRKGRLRALRYGEISVGSIDITTDAHPVNSEGRSQRRLWVFGCVTEGARYHTNYVPSARRGAQALKEIDGCVSEILT